MADRDDRMPRNGGTYRIELSGDETWNGRALHYMRRDELTYMWGIMEERRHQLRSKFGRSRATPLSSEQHSSSTAESWNYPSCGTCGMRPKQ